MIYWVGGVGVGTKNYYYYYSMLDWMVYHHIWLSSVQRFFLRLHFINGESKFCLGMSEELIPPIVGGWLGVKFQKPVVTLFVCKKQKSLLFILPLLNYFAHLPLTSSFFAISWRFWWVNCYLERR